MTRFFVLIVLTYVSFCSLSAQTDTSSVTWYFNRVDSIGGNAVTPLNQFPAIIETPLGKAALFNGINNGILLNCNPIGTATKFTIEVIFRPDSSSDLSGDKSQPRFIHLKNVDNSRRITMETRILPNQQWALDTYIRSETSNLTQLDSSQTHTSGTWHHAAIVYGDSLMRQYVDGVLQLSGTVKYLPIDTNPKISIGVRQDLRYWFKGAIWMIKVSKRTIHPSEFTLPTATSVRDIHSLPSKSGLMQNYPNPFNPTPIIYTISRHLSAMVG
jgi:hypothetical protein